MRITGNNNYNIVLVDDHPLITKAFRDTLKRIASEDTLHFNIVEAHTSDQVLAILDRISPVYQVDMIFLDIQLPPSSDGEIISGEDLGLKIREYSDDTKIVIVTAYNDPHRIHSILENINPDGFLIKDDLTPEELLIAVRHMIQDHPYYSSTVTQSVRKYFANDFVLDKIDRRLLYELSQGATLSDMVSLLPLSRPGIIKRKQRLKIVFNIQGADDRALIRKARKKGFI